MAKMPSMNFMELCRLCLVKEEVSVPIFEGEGDNRQIFVKIAACLPVKVERDDKLPKKICDSCLHKVENVYQFWNTTANSEKQLLRWLEETKTDDYSKRDSTIETEQLMVKEESVEEEGQDVKGGDDQVDLEGSDGVNSISDDESNSDDSPTVSDMGEDVQEVADKEDGDSEDLEDEDDEELEPTTFVNVSMGCEDQPGPSGAQVRMEDDPVAVDTPRPVGQPRIAPAPGPKLLPKPAQPAQLVAATAIQPAPTATAAASTSKAVALPSGSSPGSFLIILGNTNTSTPNSVAPNKPGDSRISNAILLNVLSATKNPAGPFIPQLVLAKGQVAPPKAAPALERRPAPNEQGENFTCDICNDVFKTVFESRMHMRLHGQRRPYKCNDCDKSFAHPYLLKDHKKTHLKVKEHECKYCGLKTSRQYYLKVHMRRHTKDLPYSCMVCGKSFPLKSHMTSHLKIHTATDKFECDICHKLFSTKSNLKVHRSSIHEDKKPFKCDLCTKSFPNASLLRKHSKSHLEQKEEHLCDICGKALASTTSLQQHKLVHTGERPYACDTCGKRFTKRTVLRIHIRTHTGERPYTCDICQKSFTQRSSVVIHKRYHTGERPYKCHICGKEFVSRTILKSHQKSKHGYCDYNARPDVDPLA